MTSSVILVLSLQISVLKQTASIRVFRYLEIYEILVFGSVMQKNVFLLSNNSNEHDHQSGSCGRVTTTMKSPNLSLLRVL